MTTYVPPSGNAVDLVLNHLFVSQVQQPINLLLATYVVDTGVVLSGSSALRVVNASSLQSLFNSVIALTHREDYQLSSTIAATTAASSLTDHYLGVYLAATSAGGGRSDSTAVLTVSAAAQAAMYMAVERAISEVLTGTVSTKFAYIHAVVELLLGTASASSTSHLIAALAETLAVASVIERGQQWSVGEHLTVTAALTSTAQAYYSALVQMVATSAAGNSISVFASAASGVVVNDSMSAQQILHQLVQDGLTGLVRIDIGDGEWFTGWVLNSELLAVSEYRNVPFNSVCRLGDRYLAAGSNGVFELSGKTDNGSKIAAMVQTGVMDFGTNQLKRVEAMYLGYAANGTLKLRVDLVNRGAAETYWYDVDARYVSGGEAPTPARAVLGKGMRSTYYRFTLTNSDGCDMMLNQIAILPAVTERKV